jgi:Undecaprenyl-phosphate glucose phosphotransferase
MDISSVPCLQVEADRHPRQQRAGLFPHSVIHELFQIADFCLINTAALATFLLCSFLNTIPAEGGLRPYIMPSFWGSIAFILFFTHMGGYDVSRLRDVHWQFSRVLYGWSFAILSLAALIFISTLSPLYARFWLISWTLLTSVVLLGHRALFFLLLSRSGQTRFLHNLAIVGDPDLVGSVVARLGNCAERGVAIRGVFSDRCCPSLPGNFGKLDDLARLAQQIDINQIILAVPLTDDERINEAMKKLKGLGFPGEVVISVGHTLPVRGLSYISGVPMLRIVDRPIHRWGAIGKWVEDKGLALLISVICLPLILPIALAIKLESRGPVFFVQKRFGCNNKIINVVKFRTMYVGCQDHTGGQRTVRNDPRVTRVGRILRAASLDELPQLINVLRGEMSLVGPRPHAIGMKVGEYLYSDAVDAYPQRHRVKPGITGWAQINGFRGGVDSLEEGTARVIYDLYYIEQWTVWFDMKILMLTLPAILSRKNAY